MDPGASVADPDRESFNEDVLQYLLDTLSREDLQLLLSDDEAWEGLVDEAGLSREEADALREALKETRAEPALKDSDTFHQPVRDRERFLDEFPQVKRELEELIKQLHALADRVDKVHRDCTISSVVADSTSTASGVLTILGLALAPVTAGISLAISATGLGLRIAADVMSISTNTLEHASALSAEAEASSLLTSTDRVMDNVDSLFKSMCKGIFKVKKCSKHLKDIVKVIHTIRAARDNPHLVASARQLMTTGRISVQSRRQVEKAFGGTALAMTRRDRFIGAATAGAFLLIDVASLVNDSMHLHGGAKAELAEELRQKAQELEEKLQELIQTHESLQGGPSQ